MKYIGSIFSCDGRISTYSKSVAALYPLLKDKYIPTKAKKLIFQGVLTPTLTYASENWATTVDQSVEDYSRQNQKEGTESKQLELRLGWSRFRIR